MESHELSCWESSAGRASTREAGLRIACSRRDFLPSEGKCH